MVTLPGRSDRPVSPHVGGMMGWEEEALSEVAQTASHLQPTHKQACDNDVLEGHSYGINCQVQ